MSYEEDDAHYDARDDSDLADLISVWPNLSADLKRLVMLAAGLAHAVR